MKVSTHYRAALRVVLIYGAVGLLWILLSDHLLTLIAPTEAAYRTLQSMKGGVYVGVTAVILFFLIRGEMAENSRLLAEQASLLRELDHRVKNNLQIILSLVNLRMNEIPSGDPGRGHLAAVAAQLRSLSLAHDEAYRAVPRGSVTLGRYLAAVVSNHDGEIETILEVAPALRSRRMAVDTAIPLGLIVNEVLGVSSDLQQRLSVSPAGDEPRETAQEDFVDLSFRAGGRPASLLFASCVDQLDGSLHSGLDSPVQIRVRLPRIEAR